VSVKPTGLGAIALLAAVFWAPTSRAVEPKEACIAASTDGQTFRAERRLLEARHKMLECTQPSCPEIVQAFCSRWLVEIEDQLPSLVVHLVDPSGAEVSDAQLTIDGNRANLDGRPVPMDPGTHQVFAETSTGERLSSEASLAPGEKAKLVVLRVLRPVVSATALAPATASATTAYTTPDRTPYRTPYRTEERPPSRGVPPGAWILGGTAVVAFGTAAYLIYDAYHKLDVLKGPPPAGCAPTCTDAQTAPGRADVLAADVATAIGVAALGSAIAWTLLARVDSPVATRGAHFGVSPIAGGAFALLRVDR
jgi:hypothetical protein